MNTLNITKQIIKKYNIKANKRYGQNFLIDDNILQNITEVAEITSKDLVIEIGPGLGNLTEYILNKASYALLVEIDSKMIDVLTDRLKGYNNYTLLNEDILKVNINEMVNKIEQQQNIKFEKVKVVANLPYYITTPIIFKILEDENIISDITVMVQKEVALRMVAKNNSKDYGILTLMVEYFCDANIKLEVSPNCFIPPPNVTSSVILLKKNKKYKVNNENLLFELIHKAFAQRRKKMINSLEANKFNNMNKKQIEDLFLKCNIDFNTRAEQLDIKQYIDIVNNI